MSGVLRLDGSRLDNQRIGLPPVTAMVAPET